MGKTARDAGFELGYYHFFRDNVSAEKQFANLVGYIDTRLTTLPIVLDYEKDGFVGKESEKVKKQRLRALSILVEKYGSSDIWSDRVLKRRKPLNKLYI